VGLLLRQQLSMNCLHDSIEFAIDFMIPKPQNFVSRVFQCRVAHSVSPPSMIHRMLSSVDLNDQSCATTFEIYDIEKLAIDGENEIRADATPAGEPTA
jgi:hypothetical protein